MTLEELILSCKKQNLKGQEELYKKFSSTLFSVSLKYSRSYHEAEDNLQDAFITIFKSIHDTSAPFHRPVEQILTRIKHGKSKDMFQVQAGVNPGQVLQEE